MLQTTSNRWMVLALCLGTVLTAGCADMGASTRHSWKKFWGYVDDHPNRPNIQSPHERVLELQALADEAPRRTQLEQEEVSANLAQAIRTELDPLIRAEIVRALASFQTTTATAVMTAGLNDPDSRVRVACCESLGKRPGPEAVQALGEALTNDSDMSVRLAAARALGETGDTAAVAPLGLALDESDPAMQLRAVESLRAITGREYGQDVNAWREYVAGREPPPYTPTLAERMRNLF